jgi:hypothetical protein
MSEVLPRNVTTLRLGLNQPLIGGDIDNWGGLLNANATTLDNALLVTQGSTLAPAMDGLAAAGSSTNWSRSDHVHPSDASRAPLASPALTGTPTAPTAAPGNSSTQIASTAFVAAAVVSSTTGVASFNNRTGAVVSQASDVTGVGGALLAGPAFTGVPTAPTAAADTNTLQLASTAYVIGQGSTIAPAMDGTVAVGTSTRWAHGDHVHPTDTSRAPVANAALSGVPTCPSASAGTNTGQIATTAFVQAAVVPAFDNVGRNLIDNALFNVQQRGTGPWTTQVYTMDRWEIGVVTDTVSVTAHALVDADRTAVGDEAAINSLQNVFTGNAAAGAYNELLQFIEGVRRLSGKTITVSFWAKAAVGTPKLSINSSQSFGTGGSPSAGVSALTTGLTVTLSTTWARYSVSYALPSAAGKTLGSNGNDNTSVEIGFSSGATNNAFFGNIGVQSGTVQLWGVQVEVGSVATPLEKLPPQMDLARCQRFYCTGQILGNGYMVAGGGISWPFSFPVTMRAVPAMAGVDQGSANITSPTFIPRGTGNAQTGGTATATGNTVFFQVYTASADL